MDVLIAIALVLVGAVIGFFAARFVFNPQGANDKAKAAETNIKELMSQQAEHHLYQTKQTISSIEQQCESLKLQLAEYEGLLSQSDDDNKDAFPFFGEQATTYLRNNLKGKENSKSGSVADTQPKDFANSGSGLFIGANEQSAADKE